MLSVWGALNLLDGKIYSNVGSSYGIGTSFSMPVLAVIISIAFDVPGRKDSRQDLMHHRPIHLPKLPEMLTLMLS